MLDVTDDGEKEHFYKIIYAFKFYRKFSLERISKTEHYINKLPAHHQRMLLSYRNHLQSLKECVEKNNSLLKLIVKDVSRMFHNSHLTNSKGQIELTDSYPAVSDIERVQTVLKQLVRDWSVDGAAEREACYQPIIDEIVLNFPPDNCVPEKISILVPGAGLGRLAFEIACRGYNCQGNEFSLYMLFASHFVLNICSGTNLYTVYPWIHQTENNMNRQEHMKSVRIPDVNPSEVGKVISSFSMAAGDFLEVYQSANEWDCVATCFFIDCAQNIVLFIETIYKILKPGGLWVNLGPLLYHFSTVPDIGSIELTYEEVKQVITSVGFTFEKERTRLKTTYVQNPHSMLQYRYESVFFVCRKPKENNSNEKRFKVLPIMTAPS